MIMINKTPEEFDGDWDNTWHHGPFDQARVNLTWERFHEIGYYSIWLYARYPNENEWKYTDLCGEMYVTHSGDLPFTGPVLKLPSSLRTIDEEAFTGIAAHTIVIPENTVIGKRAFAGCQAAFVVIPGTVKTIDDQAFDDCENLCFVCGSDTPAADYAEKHGIPVFDPLDE